MALEVDGEPWRTVPEEVVVRAGLVTGLELDRPVLRGLRRELRRAEALGRAARVLARRDLTEADLRARLARAGVAPGTVEETSQTLRRVGALDDVRFARTRALSLAVRGWGDEAVRLRLEAEGAPAEAAREAVSELPPEAERAASLVEGLPARRAAALLVRRGFDYATVEDLVPTLDAGTGPELR